MKRPSIIIFSLLLILHLASAKVLLTGKNTSLSFDDIQADFTPMIKKSDQRGVLYLAEPIDACSRLNNKRSNVSPSYVLIIRGGCTFEEKVRNAQKDGYKAAIVYDNEDHGSLVLMAGYAPGIHVYGTFVSKGTGEVLKEYVGRTDMELLFMPNNKTIMWSIVMVSLTSILALFAMLATWFFVHRLHRRHRRHGCDYCSMILESNREMPITIFKGDCVEGSTSNSCAICLKEYRIGEELRTLPCNHNFHVVCIDVSFRRMRSVCPVCIPDARDIPASERTLLLSPISPPVTPLQSYYSLPRYANTLSPGDASNNRLVRSLSH